MTGKHEVHRDLEQAWAELSAAVEAVPAEDREKPGVVGEWSLKDLLGHIAFWSGFCAHILRCVCNDRPDGIKFGEGDNWDDEWNEREYQARKGLSFMELRTEWLRSYKDANDCLDRTPEEKLSAVLHGDPVAAYVTANTTEHYREHTAQIREWLRNLETSEE